MFLFCHLFHYTRIIFYWRVVVCRWNRTPSWIWPKDLWWVECLVSWFWVWFCYCEFGSGYNLLGPNPNNNSAIFNSIVLVFFLRGMEILFVTGISNWTWQQFVLLLCCVGDGWVQVSVSWYVCYCPNVLYYRFYFLQWFGPRLLNNSATSHFLAMFYWQGDKAVFKNNNEIT